MRLIDADALKKILSEKEMQHDKRRSFDEYSYGASGAYEYAGYLLDEQPTVERPHGKWIKEWKEVPITGGIMHQPYWSCPRCGRKWEAYSAQFITFCSKCGMELIDGDCEESDPE